MELLIGWFIFAIMTSPRQHPRQNNLCKWLSGPILVRLHSEVWSNSALRVKVRTSVVIRSLGCILGLESHVRWEKAPIYFRISFLFSTLLSLVYYRHGMARGIDRNSHREFYQGTGCFQDRESFSQDSDPLNCPPPSQGQIFILRPGLFSHFIQFYSIRRNVCFLGKAHVPPFVPISLRSFISSSPYRPSVVHPGPFIRTIGPIVAEFGQLSGDFSL